MKRLFVTTSIGALGLFTLLLVPLQGCTDLSETPISSITPSNFFHTEGEVLAALAGVYAGCGTPPVRASIGVFPRSAATRSSCPPAARTGTTTAPGSRPIARRGRPTARPRSAS